MKLFEINKLLKEVKDDPIAKYQAKFKEKAKTLAALPWMKKLPKGIRIQAIRLGTDDPFYYNVMMAKTQEEMDSALKRMSQVRGPGAVRMLRDLILKGIPHPGMDFVGE